MEFIQNDSDHIASTLVSNRVMRRSVLLSSMLVPMLLVALGACNKGKKDKTTPKNKSTGTVTVEDTKLMGDGEDIPDAPKGTGDSGTEGDGGKAETDGDGKTADAGDKPAEPEPPKIEPPDLDVGAAGQAQAVRKHLDTARNALSGSSKDPNLALREARSALSADAANIDAVVLMAHAYYHKRLYDTAEVMLDMLFKARKKAKNHAGVYYVYGLLYDATKRPEAAVLAYEKAVEYRSGYKSAMVNLGVHYIRNHKFAEAIGIYEQLTGSLGLQNATTWTNLGSAYRGRSGNYEDRGKQVEYLHKAETAYKRALSYDKNYANVYYNLGLLYLDADPYPLSDGKAMDTLKRLERSKTYFEEYRGMSGANQDLVNNRTKQVSKLIKRETKRRKRAEKKKNDKNDDDW